MRYLLILLALASVSQAALEDYRTYTEVDPGNDIAVAENEITLTNVNTRGSTSYVYKDFGAAYFNGDFTHRFKFRVSFMNGIAFPLIWGLGNEIDHYASIAGDFLSVHLYRNGGNRYIRGRIVENGAAADVTGNVYEILLNTEYFLTIERDDDGGANSTGRLTARLYTTDYYLEPGAVEVHTFTLDSSAGEQNDFQYLYAFNTYNDGAGAKVVSGWMQDLDLSPAPPAGPSGQVIIIQ